MFDGKKTRDEILKDLADKVAKMDRVPSLAVFLIGEDPVSAKYDEIKKKFGEKIGVEFCLYKFEEKDDQAEIEKAIEYLNDDPETDGIMIQIPLPKKFDRDALISKISPEKDVDGLRYCLGLKSKFQPPVVLSIFEAIRQSGAALDKSKIAVLGKGFLVGSPLLRALADAKIEPTVVLDCLDDDHVGEQYCVFDTENGKQKIAEADIIISATGNPGLIKPEMVKDGVVLIDAGTAEESGELRGDIDPECYAKASHYTPVPGGIGPVTVAMLYRNLVG